MTEVVKTAVWFRNDLRVYDNPALFNACQSDHEVVALYVYTPRQWRAHDLSARRLGLMVLALQALQESLATRNIPLHVLNGDGFADIPETLAEFVRGENISCLHVNAEYALDEASRDRAVAAMCREQGVRLNLYSGSTIVPPGEVKTRLGQAYKVFTPFKKAWSQQHLYLDQSPLPAPAARPPVGLVGKHQIPLPDVCLETADIAGWPADEMQASQRLDEFLQQSVEDYHQQRDFPALAATSRLSPCLTIGLLSPRQCLHRARQHNQGELLTGAPGLSSWVNELVWRDFYLHVVDAFPDVCKHKAFRSETDRICWRNDASDFAAWRDGCTGFPLVDAAMRQLNTTGWMHNRLRMVAAMFLCKYLLIDWRLGERYFMQQLVDGHFPSNNGGWQWSASTGTDAAPYFRILSPVRQAERFDADAQFIKRFVPELASLPAKIIHQPGHPALLGAGYPPPMVDLKVAKERCLAAFKALSP